MEVWKDEGRNLVLVRCPACWRSMTRDGLVENNGWFQPDHYPHAYWCPNTQQKTASRRFLAPLLLKGRLIIND